MGVPCKQVDFESLLSLLAGGPFQSTPTKDCVRDVIATADKLLLDDPLTRRLLRTVRGVVPRPAPPAH